MTYAEAYNMAHDILLGEHWLLDNPGRCVLALHTIEDHGGVADDDLVHAVYDMVPGLLNYDERGNWTGPCPNETRHNA